MVKSKNSLIWPLPANVTLNLDEMADLQVDWDQPATGAFRNNVISLNRAAKMTPSTNQIFYVEFLKIPASAMIQGQRAAIVTL